MNETLDFNHIGVRELLYGTYYAYLNEMLEKVKVENIKIEFKKNSAEEEETSREGKIKIFLDDLFKEKNIDEGFYIRSKNLFKKYFYVKDTNEIEVNKWNLYIENLKREHKKLGEYKFFLHLLGLIQ